MLPGFRFLFAAIVLSMSILVFGLGAAALLRAAHEEFANLPSRRAPPEPVFARLNDDPMPSLALLRVDLPVAEKPLDDVRAAATPEIAPDIVAPARDGCGGKTASTREGGSPEHGREAARPGDRGRSGDAGHCGRDRGPRCRCRNSRCDPGNIGIPGCNRPGAGAMVPMRLKATPRRPGSPRSVVPPLSSTKGHRLTPDRSVVRKRALQRAREQRRIAHARRARLAREATLTLQQQQPNPFTPAPATAPAPTPLLRFTR